MMDDKKERKFHKPFQDKITKPKLSPIPDVSDILARDLSHHPLMNFRRSDLKKHQVDVYL